MKLNKSGKLIAVTCGEVADFDATFYLMNLAINFLHDGGQ